MTTLRREIEIFEGEDENDDEDDSPYSAAKPQ